MEFVRSYNFLVGKYHICIDNGDARKYFCAFDMEIANFLKIPTKDYRELLYKYNGTYDNFLDATFFNRKRDCMRAINFLIKKYGVLIKLLG